MVRYEKEEIKIKEYNTKQYDRAYVALITPYKEDSLEIDEDLYREHVRRYTRDSMFIKARGGIIANAEASETFYLDQKERDLLTEIAVKEAGGKFPVFSGAYGTSVRQCVEAALHAKKLGADGIFVFPPAGTMEVSINVDTAENPEVWTEHVRTIAIATGLPIILHAAAPYTPEYGRGLAPQTVKKVLEEVPSVVGYKMIGYDEANWWRIALLMRSLRRHVAILETTNSEPFTFESALLRRQAGLVDGMVQGAFNFLKEPLTEFIIAVDENDIESARKVWTTQIQPVYNVIYGRAGFSRLHIRYKIATWIRGFIPHPFMRPPMPLPRMEEVKMIFKVIEKTGLSHISESKIDEIFSKGIDIYRKYIEDEIRKVKEGLEIDK